MKGDGQFRIPVPLTANESALRAAALKANRESDQTTTAAISFEMLDEVAAVDTAGFEVADKRQFGQRTAQILSDCRRDMALAPEHTKKTVFQEIAKKLGEEVAGQWLPKRVGRRSKLTDNPMRPGQTGGGRNCKSRRRPESGPRRTSRCTAGMPTS
jgi:hypothetical protein